nr:unnamed protein product [Digitaria exilis]
MQCILLNIVLQAFTSEYVLTKFENSRQALLDSLHQVEEMIPEAIDSKITDIAQALDKVVFALDESEKQIGDEVNYLIQNESKFNGLLDENELEFLRQIAFRAGISSSTAALTERRALRRLLERAHAEEDIKKESIAAFLLHLMRKYPNIFKSETTDSTSSQCLSPSCSSSSLSSSIGLHRSLSSSTDLHGNCQALERQLPRVGSFSLKQIKGLSGSMPLPPEELRCPISLQLMYDPVVIASGQTYERACIEKWFDSGAKDDAKSDSVVIAKKFSRQNSTEVTSKIRVDDSASHKNSGEATAEICEIEGTLMKCSHQNSKETVSEICDEWLHVLNKSSSESMDEQHRWPSSEKMCNPRRLVQRLLRLFREQRQRELEEEIMAQPRVQLHEVASQAAAAQEQDQQEEEAEEEMVLAVTPAAAAANKQSGGKRPRLRRSASRRFTKAFTCLLKKWSFR